MNPVVRTNWLLTALAVILILLVSRQSSREQGDYQSITPLAASDIGTIGIQHQTTPYARLQRNAGTWVWMPDGGEVADKEWVARLAHIAELPSLRHFPAATKELAEFGLNPPRYRLTLNHQVIDFGSVDPSSGLRYVLIGDVIHLVSDGYTHHLSHSLEH